jgi:large subunit ribosomal protein L29
MATTIDAGGAAGDLRALADDELVTRLREAKEELFNLRFQSATGQLDNSRRLPVVRRGIARIYTVMRERELGIDGPRSESGPGEETG